MNSFTALVVADHHRWVAKWVRAADSAGLQQGAQIATRLAAEGMRSGRPLPTMHGELMTALGGGSVVLLEHVPGRELTGEVRDQPDLAGALARAHALLGPSEPDAGFMSWLGDDQRVGDVADWVLPAIETVLAEFRGLPSVTWGTLHADPSPEAFILDETTGEVGIIDWSAACAGPLMYDVASAVMYLGGPANARTLLEHYASGGPLTAEEINQHLPTFLRLRAIVQADYFARRVLNNDLTGIDHQTENHKGLDDAQQMLRSRFPS